MTPREKRERNARIARLWRGEGDPPQAPSLMQQIANYFKDEAVRCWNTRAPESKPQQEVCANCGKPYNDHLLWDGNKCEAGSVNGWFPKSIATALESKLGEEQGNG